MSDQDGYVVISTVEGQFVEAQIKAFLEAHDIPCQLRGESLRITHAISVDGIGAAEVLVPAALADTALREAFLQGQERLMGLGPEDVEKMRNRARNFAS